METKGIEQIPLTPSKTAISKSRGAKYGALNDRIIEKYPELVKLIQAWPKLSDQVKRTIQTLITTSNI